MIKVLPISQADIGDIIHTKSFKGTSYNFEIKRIELETEGGSTAYGKVFYDESNCFTTEKAIAKVGGIFGKTEDREGFAIRKEEIYFP